MREILVPIVGSALACLAGCGEGPPYELAPVSGTVTLNGRPLADATIGFQPAGGGKEEGPGASGTTDAQGRFALTTADGRRGATVGPNRVRVSTLKLTAASKGLEDAGVLIRMNRPDGVAVPEKVPAKYAREPLTFAVPSGGTDQANFDLTGDPPATPSKADLLKGMPKSARRPPR